jgi:hypothetical protein
MSPWDAIGWLIFTAGALALIRYVFGEWFY